MPRPSKTPSDKRKSNVWQNAQTLRWHWEVEFTRGDGTCFRKAGSKKTKDEALASRDKAYSDYNVNEARAGKWTVQTWAEHCLSEILTNENGETTNETYSVVLRNHVYPLIGRMPLGELTTATLQVYFNNLQERTSEAVANKTRTALSSCLTRAVRQNLIVANPLRMVKLAKVNRFEVEDDEDDEESRADKRIMTEEEQTKLLAAAKGTLVEPCIMLGLKCGMRIGECLGLQWSSVNLEKRTIRVKQQLKRVKGKGLVIRPPKTNAGIRTLHISDSLFAYLIELRKANPEGKWVCPNTLGNLLEPSTARAKFNDAAQSIHEKNKPDATHHDCRSTLLSYLANKANDGQGIRPSILKSIAGHSKIEVTMSYYVRASDEDVVTAMKHIP